MSAISAASVGVKTMADGTLRITFDIEPSEAGAAFALFGKPGTPAALAALAVGYAAKSDEPDKPKGGPLSNLAGQWCRQQDFQQWITPVYDRVMGGDGTGYGDITPDDAGGYERYARHAICVICDVSSRVELDANPGATQFHKLIREPYAQWHRERATA